MITSFGAEIQVQQTCFLSNSASQTGSPLQFYGDVAATVFPDELDNYVDGAWTCPWIGELQADSSLLCSGETDSDTCQASNISFTAFW